MIDNIQLVLRHYPFPIAVFYQQLQTEIKMANKGRTTYQATFLTLLDVFEVTTRFMAIVVLSDYIDCGCPDNEWNKRLGEKFNKKLSLGDWYEILRETLKSFTGNEEKLFMRESYPVFFKGDKHKAKGTRIHNVFDEFIKLRNQKKGHSLSLSDNEYKQLIDTHLAGLENMLRELSFLADYQYISPIEIEEGTITYSHQLNGVNISNHYNELTLGADCVEGDIYILNENGCGKAHLKVSPLSYFNYIHEEKEKYIYLYEDNNNKAGVIKKLTYLSITPSAKSSNFPLDTADDEYKILSKMFIQMVQPFFKESGGFVERSDTDEQWENYYFDEQRALIDFHTQSFKGRDNVLKLIDIFMDESKSGYYLIEAIPGQGKTSLLARVSKDRGSMHHFISNHGGRNSEKAMIQSLLYQIESRLGLKPRELPEDMNDLTKDFSNALYLLSQKCAAADTKELLVIDALDELLYIGERLQLSFLPQFLPPHIYFVLSSRIIKELTDLEDKFNRRYTLDKLTFGEVEKMVEAEIGSSNPNFILKLIECTSGNPLFIHCILKQIVQSNDVDRDKYMNKLPRSIEILFERLMVDLRDNSDPLYFDIFALLALAEEGLSTNELASILKVSSYKVAKYINYFAAYTVKYDNKIRLFHKKLYEYALGDSECALDEDELVKYHRLIINYCEPYEEKDLNYGLHYLPYHYYAIGDIPKVIELCGDPKNTFKKAAVRLLFDLSNTFSRSSSAARNRIYRLFEAFNTNEGMIGHILDAFEDAIYYGNFDLCEEILNNIESRYGSELEKNLLIRLKFEQATILRNRGMLDQALYKFQEIKDELLHAQTDIVLKILLEYANTAREYAMPDLALEICQEMLQRYDVESAPQIYTEVLLIIGDMLYVRGKFVEAEAELDKAIKMAQSYRLRVIEGDLIRIKGQIYYDLGDFKDAIALFSEALTIFEDYNDKVRLGRAYNSLGMAYVFTDLKIAEQYVEAALNVNNELNARLEKGKSYACLSTIYRLRENYGLSQEYIANAIELFDEVGYKSGFGKAYQEAALLELAIGKFEDAIYSAGKSSESFKRKTVSSYPVYKIRNLLIAKHASRLLRKSFDEQAIWDEEWNISIGGEYREFIDSMEMEIKCIVDRSKTV